MSVSDLLARKMVEKHVIEKEEFELYQYSINALLELGGNIILTIIIGIVIDKILPTILFLLIVVPVRSFIGGCHAKTSLGCFFMSIIVYIICVLYPSYLIDIPIAICLLIVFVSGVIIYAWAPVSCLEKPISKAQSERMKRYSKISVTVLWLLSVCTCFVGNNFFLVELMLIMCYFLITLIIEKKRKEGIVS